MNQKGSFDIVKLTLDISGFGITIGGIILVRFANNDYVAIIGGILVAVGMGLLGVARLIR